MFKKYFLKSLNNLLYRNFFTRTVIKLRGKQMNFYEILGIERGCTQEQVREAYLKLVKVYHPDLNKDPGASDKFKMITLAYEALHNDKNREVYDAFVKSDPHAQEWKYKEEQYKDYEKDFFRDKARYDKFSQDYYKTKTQSNFWAGKRDSFEEEIYKEYDNIFKSDIRKKAKTKGEDIYLEISISLFEAFKGIQKGVNLKRKEKCRSCNGNRSAQGSRPSKCFHCNGQGQIKTNLFNSKPCGQCKGTGFLIKHPCKECHGKGLMEYDSTEVFPIPKGIISGQNIRLENKGHSSENFDFQNGDLVIKVTIEQSDNYERKGQDIHFNIKISLLQAIFGDTLQIDTFEGKKEIVIPPGTQNGDKILLKNMGMPKLENDKIRGDMLVLTNVLIPNINEFSKEDSNLLIKILKK